MNPRNIQHAQACIGILVYTFLATYLPSPSVSGYLSHHAWLADLVGAALATWNAYQSYSKNPAPTLTIEHPKENP